jgi:5-methylcytosine-specific restriction protein A
MTQRRLKCIKPRLAPTSKGNGWQPDSLRGNRHERGYGAEWDRLRKAILERDCGVCQACGHLGNEVDHKTPKALGGTDDPSNLQTLCTDCHKTKTARESRDAWA